MLQTLLMFLGGVQAVTICQPDFTLWPENQDIRPLVACSDGGEFGVDCLTMDAGLDFNGFANSNILIDSATVDVPHDPGAVTFQWTQVPNGAPTVVLSNDDTLTPGFLPTQAGTYEFELEAAWYCRMATDRVVVTVEPFVGPPTALDAEALATFDSDTLVQAISSNPGDDRLFLVRKSGRIMIYKNGAVLPDPFLDISGLVSSGSEQGLLGLAFDPDYAVNGSFYVNYTGRNPDGSGSLSDTRIVAYQRDAANPDLADPSQNLVLMSISQPFSNHNGGMLAFGADGFLYIGTGDGGSANDPQNNSQNPLTLLGKMLRIDVNGLTPYTIPPGNPFLGDPGTLDEIWALGLRNPWRFSFDQDTGDMYIGDVGQSQLEEIDFEPSDSLGGVNYGWRLKEGTVCFIPSTNCDPDDLLTDPVHEYQHSSGRCSVTGGYVYRGSDVPILDGYYIFGDFCTGEYWLLREDMAIWTATDLDIFVDDVALGGSDDISAFGQDLDGELYVLTRRFGDATVYKITGLRQP